MNKISLTLKNFWQKLKKIKHIEIILTVLAALIILAIYFSSFNGKKDTTTSTDKVSQETTLSFNSSAEYVNYLENRLDNVLSSVKNAGKVNVIITLETGFEYEYATEEETRQTGSGTITSTKLVLVDGQPVVVKEHFPIIKGIVVVASGGDDVKVKMDILTVIQTVVNVENSKIVIIAGN